MPGPSSRGQDTGRLVLVWSGSDEAQCGIHLGAPSQSLALKTWEAPCSLSFLELLHESLAHMLAQYDRLHGSLCFTPAGPQRAATGLTPPKWNDVVAAAWQGNWLSPHTLQTGLALLLCSSCCTRCEPDRLLLPFHGRLSKRSAGQRLCEAESLCLGPVCSGRPSSIGPDLLGG